jgi:hypothetical protein
VKIQLKNKYINNIIIHKIKNNSNNSNNKNNFNKVSYNNLVDLIKKMKNIPIKVIKMLL